MTVDKLQLVQWVQWEDQKAQFQKTCVVVTFFLVSWLIGLYGTAAFTFLQHLAYTAIDAPLFRQLRFTFNDKNTESKINQRPPDDVKIAPEFRLSDSCYLSLGTLFRNYSKLKSTTLINRPCILKKNPERKHCL